MEPETTFVTVGKINKSRVEDGVLRFELSKASGPELDADGMRASMDWLMPAMSDWFATGANIREQHDPHKAIGKALELAARPDGPWISGIVADPVAVKKAELDILTQLSIGIRNGRLDKSAKALAMAPGGLIVGGKIVEVSLCDRGSNPTTKLILAKAAEPDGHFEAVEEIVEKAERVEHSHSHAHGDGHHRHQHTHGPGVAEHRSLDSGVAHNHQHDDNAPELIEDVSPEDKVARPDIIKRDFTAEERRELASKGQALSDGSYPIPDADALRRAAILARSGHGDVAAAKRLIAKRAKELGVSNPLDEESDEEKTLRADWGPFVVGQEVIAKAASCDPDGDGDDDSTPEGDTDHDYWNEDGTPTEKGRAAGFSAPEKTEAPDLIKTIAGAAPAAIADLRKALGIDSVESTLAEGLKSLVERVEKIEATPIPGGPARTRTDGQSAVSAAADHLRHERDGYLRMAERFEQGGGDIDLAKSYRALADQKTHELEKLAAPGSTT